MTPRIRADFNGLFGDVLCLSHADDAVDEQGTPVRLAEGLQVLAFENDSDEGLPCFLVASGHVVPAPHELARHGSRWCLAIDARGVRHVPRLDDA
jgi:hypothetical protein